MKEEFQMVNSFAVNKDDILLTRAQKKQLKDKEVEDTEKTESTNPKSIKNIVQISFILTIVGYLMFLIGVFILYNASKFKKLRR